MVKSYAWSVCYSLVFLFMMGCPPKSASLLITQNDYDKRASWNYMTIDDGDFYSVFEYLTTDTLMNYFSKYPYQIEQLNGEVIRPHTIQIIENDFVYTIHESESKVSFDEVRVIRIYDPYTFQDFLITTGNSFLTGAAVALFPAVNRDSFREAGKNALIGGAVFAVLGNLLEYNASKNHSVQVIFVNGVEEFRY